MSPENRRQVDNWRSIIRDILSGGTFLVLIGYVFYAGQLVEQLKKLNADFVEYKIIQNARIVPLENDISILRDWKVACTQVSFNEFKPMIIKGVKP
jgi:hypothetical protein